MAVVCYSTLTCARTHLDVALHQNPAEIEDVNDINIVKESRLAWVQWFKSAKKCFNKSSCTRQQDSNCVLHVSGDSLAPHV